MLSLTPPEFLGQFTPQFVPIDSLDGCHALMITFEVLVESLNDSGWVSCCDDAGWYGFCHDAACADGRVWADLYTRK